MSNQTGILADGFSDTVAVEIGEPRLRGLLGIPAEPIGVEPSGMVIFAHGSGSGRFSPRNNHVAERLRRAGMATLLLDLLTHEEESDRRNVFDVGLLARRLALANDWVGDDARTRDLSVGYFWCEHRCGGGNDRCCVARRSRCRGRLRSVADRTMVQAKQEETS